MRKIALVVRMIYYEQFVKEYNNDEDYINFFKFNQKEMSLIKDIKNKEKQSASVKKILEGLFEASKSIHENYNLRSAYEQYNEQVDEDIKTSKFCFLRTHPLFTNYTPDFAGTIDYIFYSKHFMINKILKIPEEKEIKDSLPNKMFPSDHLRLFCEFSYRNIE